MLLKWVKQLPGKLFAIPFLMLLPAITLAQEARFSVKFEQGSLEQALNLLRKVTGTSIAFSKEEINGAVIPSSEYSNKTVEQILNSLLTNIPFGIEKKGTAWLVKKTAEKQKKPGRVSGRIIDEENAQPVPGATIRIGSNGVTTDEIGAFTLSLPKGQYEAEISSIGYGTKKVTEIIIKDDEIFTIDIPLKRAKGQLSTVTVSSRRIKETGTIAAIITEIREADAVVSGISREQISRSQDRDAAEVVRRIPGISVVNNRFVVVRGLPQRYNTVMLNGTTAPSFEADSRAFSFDIMPSSMVDRILVYKTALPELPGDFAGGLVKIYTTGMPVKNFFNVSFQTSFRQGTTLKEFYEQPQGSKAFLGYDDGTYGLPAAFKKVRETNGRIDLLSPEQRRPLTKMLNENWEAGQRNAPLDTRLNIDFARRFALGKNVQFGFVSAFSHTNTYRYQVILRNTGKYTGGVDDIIGDEIFKREYTFSDQTYEHAVRLNGLVNLSLAVGENHQIEFKNLYTHLGSSTYINRSGVAGTEATDSDQGYLSQPIFTNTYRGTYLAQLSGHHKFFNKKTEINWLLAYNQTKYNDPDQRSREFYADDTSKYYGSYSLKERELNADIISDVNRGRQFITLPDTSRTLGIDIVQHLKFLGITPQLKAGIFVEDKGRTFEFIQLGYVKDDPRYGPGYIVAENFGRHNSYTASNLLQAGYLSTEIPIRSWKITGGVRIEKNKQELNTFSWERVGPNAGSEINLNREHTSVLPSVNISYNLNSTSLVRVAYSKTLNRPEFREIASFYYKDYYTGRLAYGNPNLKTQTDISNLDLRVEHYPGLGEMISLGVFYKEFKNPVEFYYYVGTSSRNNFQWGNAESAKNYGAELELILGLQRYFSEKNWVSRQLQKVSILVNAAYIHSRVNLGPKAGIQDKERPMYGQSPYLINGSINYTDEDKGLKLTASYNVIGKRLFGIGNTDYPNIYEMPQNLLDLSFSKQITKIWELKGGIQNLLNARSMQLQDVNRDGKYKASEGAFDAVDNLYQSSYEGTYFTVGVGIKL
ncbi:TonB-dependent receptor plug domain-containing protein [Chitinophaga sp. SYP-B3965]|uniref:TonB-dependent receptor n=1 Tax=Chitinophaga sp. SYP-B3965 TaxID=2663120 RepID=UPI001299810E|nr:TonB-dependent receptor [Chitinophaga sp. SYP-B3965]MRG44105.1 TonB-dependent receptor plug domain-containing protein [Chitinophaga sp. SYP-B3965]